MKQTSLEHDSQMELKHTVYLEGFTLDPYMGPHNKKCEKEDEK